MSWRPAAVTVAVALVAAALSGPPAPAAAGAAPATPPGGQQAPSQTGLRPLRAVTGGAHPRIVDDRGRQMLLRGVNVVQLGDYYQEDPRLPATFPLGERDFERMARLGFDVVRLVLSWSRLEPAPGRLSDAYLDRIERAVDRAAEHGLYVVLDMHQDAWGKHVDTPAGTACPPPLQPAIGWDGAPAWATFHAGGPATCKAQVREASAAVTRAFTAFWADRPAADGIGIQQHLVGAWGALAARFADRPAVAGYDLLNEPHPGLTIGVTDTVLLGRYYDRAIDAIRRAEEAAGGFHHIVFFEPIITWSALGAAPPVQPAFTTDDNIVFAPHLYAGSLSVTPGVGVEEGYRAAAAAARLYGTTFWAGEWGWYGDPAAAAAQVRRFAELQDDYAVGGTWWSWRQACGDPHNFRTRGAAVAPVSPSLVRYACPSGEELGIPPAFERILSRPYPRAAPGRITALESDPRAVTLHLEGRTPRPGRLELWVPAREGASGAPPVVTGDGVGRVRVQRVDGGFRVRARVRGHYTVDVRSRPPGRSGPAGPAAAGWGSTGP